MAGLSSASRKMKFSPDQKEVKAAILKGERVLVVGQEVTNFTGKIMSLVLSFTVGNKLYCLLLSLGSLPLSLIHISEPTRLQDLSRMPSSA